MSVHLKEEYLQKARDLIKDTVKNNGLAPLDIEAFWKDQDTAFSDPWSQHCPQLPISGNMSYECVFDELGIPETAQSRYRIEHDIEYRMELVREYNKKAMSVVGRKMIDEEFEQNRTWDKPVKTLADIFEAPETWRGDSYWIGQSAGNDTELAHLLDRVEKRLENLREFIFPPDWQKVKESLIRIYGTLPLYRYQRGPVTFAMSIYGVENLIFLILDNPDLTTRFRDLILKAIITRAAIIDKEAGYTAETAPHGWSWADDNCAMLNPEMYEFFGYPILKRIFDIYACNPEDTRYQHSDSEMAHLLPALRKLNFTGVNFGPTLTVSEIREYCPYAVIYGQLAPFTFSRNEQVNIAAETIRDFEMSREKKGVVFSTAGSINNGSLLTGLRIIMACVQRYCRY